MKVTLLATSVVGRKTRSSLELAKSILTEKFPTIKCTLLDLKELDLIFSDGRNYLDYQGDTLLVTKTLMESDIILIGTPTFQASIPGTLKNVFDLLPPKAFFRKTVSVIATAGSPKHYLMVENQLKPILNYMKANVVPNYVFLEDRDFDQQKVINDDVHFRLETLIEDTIVLSRTYQRIWEEQEAEYDF